MSKRLEKGETVGDPVIGTSSGKELLFSGKNVAKMSRILGPIKWDQGHRGWVRNVDGVSRLVFGGDGGIAPDYAQRTRVDYSYQEDDSLGSGIHIMGITRVESDPYNPEALKFIKEGAKGISTLTVFKDGTAAYSSTKK